MTKAVVIGLARSGVGAANLLASRGYAVTVTDSKPASELSKFSSQLSAGVKLALGGHPDGLMEGASLVVVSPGVPMSAPPVKKAIAMGLEVISELELGFRYLGGAPVYAVTGTNGKSTTVTLLDLMFRRAGKRALLAGNIGNSLCAELMDESAKFDCVTVEVSSFQLEAIRDFRPRGAAILNVTPDHMDRYAGINDYMAAKARISENQDASDFLVLNADDPMCERTRASVKGKPEIYYFSRSSEVRGMYLSGGSIMCALKGPAERLIGVDDVLIKGAHNEENAMAAAMLALLGGCTYEAVRSALAEFTGLEHRLELVRTLDGVDYINDSKGTNVGAVLKSLDSFGARKVVLIAGGRDKDGKFDELVPLVRKNARAVVLIGEAAGKIERALRGAAELVHSGSSMQDAVAKARELARPGDVVLLSPACASFDMFDNFEHRGRVFKELVMAL